MHVSVVVKRDRVLVVWREILDDSLQRLFVEWVDYVYYIAVRVSFPAKAQLLYLVDGTILHELIGGAEGGHQFQRVIIYHKQNVVWR